MNEPAGNSSETSSRAVTLPRRRPKCLLRWSIRRGALESAGVMSFTTSEVTRRPTDGHYDWQPFCGRARYTRGARPAVTDGHGGRGYRGRHEPADGT